MPDKDCRSALQPVTTCWSFQFGGEYALVITEKRQTVEAKAWTTKECKASLLLGMTTLIPVITVTVCMHFNYGAKLCCGSDGDDI